MAIPESSNGYNEKAAGAHETQWKGGHVLVMPYPAQGHINPMMHLSTHLAAHGVLVTFINTQFNHDRIMRSRGSSPADHHNQTYPQGNIRFVGLPDGLGYDEYVANFSVPKQAQALIDLEPSLVKLVEETQPPVTCIIADVFVISAPAVARRFNIPHVAFWTQTAASYACHVFFSTNHSSLKGYVDKLRSEGKEDERMINCVPSCPTMSYNELPTFLQPCDPSDFLFSYLIENFQAASHSRLVLMNTFEHLEEDSLAYIHAPNILCIGPLLPPHYILNDDASSRSTPKNPIHTLNSSFWVEDSEGCMPWLHKQKPSSVLYVSFGSITIMSVEQIAEFAAGLEASGCPFLMVVRPEMMEGGVAATFPDGFIDKMRESGRAAFVPWAPQLEILAHPAIGGFLTHGGWNSTLESICKGVPMLCWPYFADQMLNTRCIVDMWKIGLDFTTDKVTNNEQCKSSTCGNDNDLDSNKSKNGKTEEVSLVKQDEIERKIRQLMNPSTSKEFRERIENLSFAAKRAYESSSSSGFKSLLDVISY